MVGYAVDGVIWVPVPLTSGHWITSPVSTPVVIILRRLPNDPVDTVVSEDRAGIKAAIQHLLSLWHERMGNIGGDKIFSKKERRWQGYLEAPRDLGLPVWEALVKLWTHRNRQGDDGDQ